MGLEGNSNRSEFEERRDQSGLRIPSEQESDNEVSEVQVRADRNGRYQPLHVERAWPLYHRASTSGRAWGDPISHQIGDRRAQPRGHGMRDSVTRVLMR